MEDNIEEKVHRGRTCPDSSEPSEIIQEMNELHLNNRKEGVSSFMSHNLERIENCIETLESSESTEDDCLEAAQAIHKLACQLEIYRKLMVDLGIRPVLAKRSKFSDQTSTICQASLCALGKVREDKSLKHYRTSSIFKHSCATDDEDDDKTDDEDDDETEREDGDEGDENLDSNVKLPGSTKKGHISKCNIKVLDSTNL